MNIMHVTKDDIKNGSGIRVVVWVAGCGHNCQGCHNPETHEPTAGKPFTEVNRDYVLRELQKPHIHGLTLSGGDPFFEDNLDGVGSLILDVRRVFGESKTIWVYTGWKFEDFMNKFVLTGKFPMEVFKYIDVIVDGKFIDLPEFTVPTPLFRGSSNQRIIDVKKSLDEGQTIIISDDEVERY